MAQTKNITFRLGIDHHDRLVSWAEDEGVSKNDQARQIVKDAIVGREATIAVAAELEALREEVSELRQDLAVATRALLVNSGKIKDADAQRWVRENLKE